MTPTKQDPPAQDAALQDAEGWRPNPGDVLKGEVVEIKRAWSDWTDSWYPLVIIRDQTRNENVGVHCFHATLQERLMAARPKIGDELEIAYLGKRPTKDGKREAAIYKVTIPGETGAEVWDSLEGQRPRAAEAAKQGTLPTDDEEIPF